MHYELILQKKGYHFIAGIDEAGRGAWAGPLFVGAVILPLGELKKFKGVGDSKKLTAEKREICAKTIKKYCVAWAIGRVESGEIDSLGLQNAHLLAVERAVLGLGIMPDYVLVDRIAKVKFPMPFENVIKGDDKFISVGAASIMAKVERDAEMSELENKYPNYHFKEHKGYGTGEHMDEIAKFGLCDLHRRLFSPIKEIDKKMQLF
ncbi:MAG TPA: ribonuclease HII [Candidatus Bipolaricaulota bacterium]|nr:ribonuclease HII [Candidatus Bipolaricaulota bacterium]